MSASIYERLIVGLESADPSHRWQHDVRMRLSRQDYDELRAAAYPPDDDGNSTDPEPDPEKRVPAKGDMVLGLPIEVVEIAEPRVYSPSREAFEVRMAELGIPLADISIQP